DPEIADQSSSNGFESDNDGSGTLNAPITSPTWWNVTLVGPKKESGTTINSLYKRGMHLRRSSRNKISNALIVGWPTGIRLDGTNTIQGAINNLMWVNNSIVAGWSTASLDTASAGGANFNIDTWWTNSNGRKFTSNTEVLLTDAFNLTNPNFLPTSSSPALTGGATPPNDGFFDVTATFVGAFGPTDWSANWADFTPVGYVTSVDENQISSLPVKFNLTQNYPNPFNPSTKIVYSVTEPSQVKLTVTNILGQVVETLVNDFRSNGTYEVTFDSNGLTSGLYIYTLEAGSTSISKKMTLLK
ncbi:MAG: T9SS type A sorting domain-containing protein, partial [Ignavibacteria bacterium]|nr:T9SS type A sorting domain-containing protein [Ignavibacteria bacterium]